MILPDFRDPTGDVRGDEAGPGVDLGERVSVVQSR